ncbi:hypothetical protein BpHYR1_004903 [Brachionus plicatilis]|uniref:Uncharacterized protein n=1 Tax=Brachionus plicatilis TaxID=10195 RepID=A0A3M7RQL0_BRAPC|nr:hypothetical protein BpHYR1_004903 [Brachionus plicatilis]
MKLTILFFVIIGFFLSPVVSFPIKKEHLIKKRQYVKPSIDGIWLAEDNIYDKIFMLRISTKISKKTIQMSQMKQSNIYFTIENG